MNNMSLPAFTASTAARPAAADPPSGKSFSQAAHDECIGDDQALEAHLLLQQSGDDSGRDRRHVIRVGIERRDFQMCATITASTPASMAARNGGSSMLSRRARSPLITGTARWESLSVSP